MDTQTQKLIDDATAGLRHDPELRLDVQKELLSHLEQTAEDCRATGCEDAEEQARKTFGSPLELAAELLDSNRRRMRLRALARLFIQGLLVPLAVLATLYLGYGGLVRLAVLMRNPMFQAPEPIQQLSLPTPPGSLFPSRGEIDAQLDALSKYQGHPSDYMKLRHLWEQHQNDPDAHEYYGYYASFITGERHPRYRLLQYNSRGVPIPTPRTTPTPSDAREAKAFAWFEEKMRLGEQTDPDNALYHLKLANAYLNDALLAQSEKTQPLQPGETPDDLKDPLLLDLGVAEVRAMLQKPVLTTYSMAMVRRRDASLPPPKLSEGYLLHSSGVMSELFPMLAQERALARRIPGCIRLLIAQGRVDEANYLLENWWRYPEQLVRGSDSLIHLLVADAITRILGTEIADIYQSLGRDAEVERVRRDVTRLTAAVTARKEIIRNTTVSKDELRRHGAYIANRGGGYLLENRYLSIAEMRPGRLYEYTMLEQFAASLAILLLAVLMLVAAVTGYAWLRALRERGAVPLLLLPNWRESARIVLLGLVLPLAVYVLYSRLPIGGREYGLYTNWPRFLAEMVVMLGLLLYLPERLMRTAIRRRCYELDIPLPKPGMPLITLALLTAVISGAAIVGFNIMLGISTGSELDRMFGRFAGSLVAFLVLLLAICIAVLVTLLLVRAAVRYWRTRRGGDFALYRGTLARSLIPLYAAAVILLGGLAQPLLLREEACWLRQDHSLYPTLQYAEYPLAPGTVEKMKAQVLQAAEEIEREGK
ncbi:MAG: hypothetical protein ACYDCO_09035 [Armatimonadota bacterium]